jgi:hypothetical protein
MSPSKRRLLVPAALVVASCTPGPGPTPKVCVEDNFTPCLPDGGYVCGSSECAGRREADGGWLRDTSGEIQCLC